MAICLRLLLAVMKIPRLDKFGECRPALLVNFLDAIRLWHRVIYGCVAHTHPEVKPMLEVPAIT